MQYRQDIESINTNTAVSEMVHETDIPVLDINDSSTPEILIKNIKKIGFFIITNHGITNSDFDKAFKISRKFFMKSSEDKQLLRYNKPLNTGYMSSDFTKLTKYGAERKQTLDLGNYKNEIYADYYPKDSEFYDFFTQFYDKLENLAIKIYGLIEKGLNLPKDTIYSKCNQKINTMRLLYYTPFDLDYLEKHGKLRTSPHSDFGIFTLLLQKVGENQTGLRALNRNNQWTKVSPPDYGIVVNIADLLQHWSNDVLVSTVHKVEVEEEIIQKLRNKQIGLVPERQSIAYFCNPAPESVITCLQNCGEPKYSPVKGFDYIMGRLATFIKGSY